MRGRIRPFAGDRWFGKGPRSALLHAASYLEGQGIEIAARDHPLPVSRGVRVTYVDELWTAQLRQVYPELASRQLVPVSLLDRWDRLARVADRCQDFVIAQSCLERLPDPLGALLNFLRVLRPGGVLVLTTTDQRYTTNRDRPVASLDHLLLVHTQGTQALRNHFEEHTRYVHDIHDPLEVARQVAQLRSMRYSVYYHVWTQHEFLQTLWWARARLRFDFELVHNLGRELITVLRRSAMGQESTIKMAA